MENERKCPCCRKTGYRLYFLKTDEEEYGVSMCKKCHAICMNYRLELAMAEENFYGKVNG